jgi:hypothetical protein
MSLADPVCRFSSKKEPKHMIEENMLSFDPKKSSQIRSNIFGLIILRAINFLLIHNSFSRPRVRELERIAYFQERGVDDLVISHLERAYDYRVITENFFVLVIMLFVFDFLLKSVHEMLYTRLATDGKKLVYFSPGIELWIDREDIKQVKNRTLNFDKAAVIFHETSIWHKMFGRMPSNKISLADYDDRQIKEITQKLSINATTNTTNEEANRNFWEGGSESFPPKREDPKLFWTGGVSYEKEREKKKDSPDPP